MSSNNGVKFAVAAYFLEGSVSIPPGYRSRYIFWVEVTACILHRYGNIHSVYKRTFTFCIDTFCVRMPVKLLEGKGRLFWGIFLLINGKIHSVYKRNHKFCINTFCVRMAACVRQGKGRLLGGILFCFLANKSVLSDSKTSKLC